MIHFFVHFVGNHVDLWFNIFPALRVGRWLNLKLIFFASNEDAQFSKPLLRNPPKCSRVDLEFCLLVFQDPFCQLSLCLIHPLILWLRNPVPAADPLPRTDPPGPSEHQLSGPALQPLSESPPCACAFPSCPPPPSLLRSDRPICSLACPLPPGNLRLKEGRTEKDTGRGKHPPINAE